MPSASDIRDILPTPTAAASIPSKPTTTAAGEVESDPSASTNSNSKPNEAATAAVDFTLLPPPLGKYATQAQAQAAKILAASGSGSSRSQGQEQGQDQDKMEVDVGKEDQARMAGQAENGTASGSGSGSGSGTKEGDGKSEVPERVFPIPTRKIIQIEGRRRDDLVPHQGLTSSHTNFNSNVTTKPSTRTQAQSSIQPGLGQVQTPEKMDGLTRELYALIGDNAPSLAQVRAELAGLGGVGGSGSGRKWMVGGGGKGMGKEKVVRRWRQTPFQPSNRSTPLTLHHWRPLPSAPIIQGATGNDKLKVEEKDPFEAFGREGNGPNVMSYSQVEYEAWLTDDKWTPHETNYLFSLLKTYDLRFLVVTDRYAYVPPGGKTGQDGFEGVYAWPSLVAKAGAASGAAGGASGRKKGKETALAAGESVRRSSRMGVGAGGRNSRGATPVASTSTSTAMHTVAPVETDIKTRTMEEIKDRYYTVCRRLLRNRPAVDEAFKEKMVKAFDYDIHREVARKKYANSLFHLTRPQMLEEEALYVELKRMEQTERRYRSDREELMRIMGGLDSGVLVPGEQGNRAFGRGEAIGVGVARGADGSVLADKLKKRRRGEDGEPAQDVDMPPPPPVKKKVDPMFDERNNITRVPPQPGQLTTSRNTHQPVYLRSTRLPTPKPHLATKTNALLSQMSISTVRLVMPTRDNVVALEKVIHSAEGLVEMKRLVDRVEVEVRTLKAQRDGIVPSAAGAASGSASVPVDVSGSAGAEDLTPKSEDGPELTGSVPKSQRSAQRSASVVSSTTSELRRKK